MIRERYEVLSCFLPLIFNGDFSGLSRSELAQWQEFEDDVVACHGECLWHWSHDTDNSSSFGCCEATGFMGDIAEIEFIGEPAGSLERVR